DVLPAFDLVSHNATRDGAAGLKLVQLLSTFRFEHLESAEKVPGEHDTARCWSDSTDHRRRLRDSPQDLAGAGIQGMRPALGIPDRVRNRNAAEVERARGVGLFRTKLVGDAPIY